MLKNTCYTCCLNKGVAVKKMLSAEYNMQTDTTLVCASWLCLNVFVNFGHLEVNTAQLGRTQTKMQFPP